MFSKKAPPLEGLFLFLNRRDFYRAYQGNQAPKGNCYRCSLSGLTGLAAPLPPGSPFFSPSHLHF